MKKTVPLIILGLSFILIGCGQKNSDVVVRADTQVTDRDQSAKICEPYLKYLECSLKNNTDESKKPIIQDLIKITKKSIKNDTPARVAQQCDAIIRSIAARPEVATQHGCEIPVSVVVSQ